jgi:hypothetical protein
VTAVPSPPAPAAVVWSPATSPQDDKGAGAIARTVRLGFEASSGEPGDKLLGSEQWCEKWCDWHVPLPNSWIPPTELHGSQALTDRLLEKLDVQKQQNRTRAPSMPLAEF